ncbi:MAG: polyhydroxyalkanoate depolymerase [Citromicrobium sp.]|nr:polyhydroxyalkanoate depolymerase [Citromicrobium sp.]
MLYHAYELQSAWLNSASAMASIGSEWLTNPRNPMAYTGFGPIAGSALEVFAPATIRRGKPEFDIESVTVKGKADPVSETLVLHRPFGDLKRFRRANLPGDAPAVLIVAPMSGHFATLLRGTVERMVENSEVYITDWHDARDIPLAEGRFDLDDYIDYIIEFLQEIAQRNDGKAAHMIAVCQPSVPALAATALMNGANDKASPITLTMMGGPIDTRESPTTVNDMAMKRPLSWFRQNVIATVPAQYAGSGRRVYPGFMQLASFMSMNLGGHILSHYEMYKHLVAGEDDSAQLTKDFYEEYRSVCDMTAEFYLQTVEEVFQKHSLPNNELEHRGKVIDLGDIKQTALLAVEGERDDISGIGQTKAALTLARNLSDKKKRYYLAEGAGHYGIFNGSKWRTKIAPVVEEFMGANG